jgi:HEAT repeat protein
MRTFPFLLLLASTLAGCGREEASFAGRPESAWARDLTADDTATSERATAVLLDGGADALPLILGLLRHDRVEVRRSAASVLLWSDQDEPLIVNLLPDHEDEADVEVRCLVTATLGRLVSCSEDAVGRLGAALYGDPSPRVRARAARALGEAGGEGDVPPAVLVKALRDEDVKVRSRAAEALGAIGRPEEDVLFGLAIALRDSEAEVKLASALALARLGKPSVPLLIDALGGDEDRVSRISAVYALGRIGAEAVGAVAHLTALVGAKDPDLADAARRALASIQGEGE